jgi:uncharacterized membrane protein YfcA
MTSEWIALPAGFVIATLATMVGFGGGVLWMPFLLLVARLEPAQAVTTSLIIQVAGMGSGSLAVIKARKADFSLSFFLSVCAFIGIPVGVWLSNLISPDSIIFLLGVISMAMALVFVYTHDDSNAATAQKTTLRQSTPYLLLSTLFAVLTGLLSMGVGDFLVPILRNRLKLGMEAAMATCLVVMAASAAFAAGLHLLVGDSFASRVVLWSLPGVLIGGQIGPRLAGRIDDRTLKEIFILGLSLAGIHMMFNVQAM